MKLLHFLEPTNSNIFTWFKHNAFVVNSGKSHFLISLYDKISLNKLDFTVEPIP